MNKLLKIGAIASAAIGTMTTSAFASATAAGDKFDGVVELQDLAQGILDKGGIFGILLLSVIVGGALYAITRQMSHLVTPIALGVFFSVAIPLASGLVIPPFMGSFETRTTQPFYTG